MGYVIQQSTKPQTLGIGLQDSPAGLLAWIAEKLQAWSDSDGDLFNAFTPDQVLTNVMIYWVSGCATSSLRFYWESRMGGADGAPRGRIEVPTGVTDFPGERAITTLLDRSALQPRALHVPAPRRPLRRVGTAGVVRRRRGGVLPHPALRRRR